MKKFTLTVAEVGDIQGIQDLIYPNYFQETIYKDLDYDASLTHTFIQEWVKHYCIIAKDENGKVVGVTAFYFVNTYYKQKECDVLMFYVDPEFRGSKVARSLVNYIIKTCELRGDVGVIYTSSGSGMKGNNNTLYTNLFKKFGFKHLGSELVRLF